MKPYCKCASRTLCDFCLTCPTSIKLVYLTVQLWACLFVDLVQSKRPQRTASEYLMSNRINIGKWLITAIYDCINLEPRDGALPKGNTSVQVDAKWEARVRLRAVFLRRWCKWIIDLFGAPARHSGQRHAGLWYGYVLIHAHTQGPFAEHPLRPVRLHDTRNLRLRAITYKMYRNGMPAARNQRSTGRYIILEQKTYRCVDSSLRSTE